MATGYAVMIVNGASFEEFVMKCGVVAGAQLALHGPAPEQESPGRELVAAELRTLQEALTAFEIMSDESAQEACDAEYDLTCREWESRYVAREGKRVRYLAVLERLLVWPTPGAVFEAFKADMVQQIETSMRSDCDASRDLPPVRMSPNEWRVQQITEKQSAIEHLERTAARYAWMHELRASLGLTAEASAPL